MTVFFQQQQLLRRGWSPGLICRLLGEPDAVARNSHNDKRPTRLFNAECVSIAEAMPAFVAHQIWRQSRTARAAKIKRRETQARRRALECLPIRVPVMKPAQLKRAAINSWCVEEFRRTKVRPDPSRLSRGEQARLAVRYLTDGATYNERAVEGTGKRDREILNRRIFDSIRTRYPRLVRDCTRP